MSIEKTRENIIKHCRLYPEMEIQDLYKFLYQSTFGCEHMVSSIENVEEHLQNEVGNTGKYSETLIDDLDGEYSRVHLTYLEKGLSVKTLAKLFLLSAKKEDEGKEKLKEKLSVARSLICSGETAFDIDEFDEKVKKWEEAGYPAVHHSNSFREKYALAYRLVSEKFIPFLPLFIEIDKLISKKPFGIVAIEGGSASGKTTLAKILESIYDCNVFHMDDFFLRKEQRTEERYSEVGGNIDYERFLEEVLIPLKKGETINYRRFNCETMELEKGIPFCERKLSIVEGAYSMHPQLASYYDLSAFLEIGEELQKSRVQKRNTPEMAKRFFETWIPFEKVYFTKLEIKEKCNMIFEITK